MNLAPAAWEGHIAGPGIALAVGALDEQDFGAFGGPGVDDQRHRGLARGLFGLGYRAGLVPEHGASNIVQSPHGGILVSWRLSCPAVILISNDDGADSPALRPLVRAVAKDADVRVVVPDGERSWVGKAISRFGALSIRRVEDQGIETVLVSGSPADCVNLGVHTVFPETPELVVTGVNVGLNVGAAFFLSSGTVGAAIEGRIAGVPAIAFSTGIPDDDREWKADSGTAEKEPMWERLAALSADIVARVRANGFPPGADLISVNFPVDADVNTPRAITRVAPVGYPALFHETEPGVFNHAYGGGIRAEPGALVGSDVEAVRAVLPWKKPSPTACQRTTLNGR